MCSPVQLGEVPTSRNLNHQEGESSRLDGLSGARSTQSWWHGLRAEDGHPERRCQHLPQAGARLSPVPGLHPRAGSLGPGLRGTPEPEPRDRAPLDQKLSPASPSRAKARPDVSSFLPARKPQALDYTSQHRTAAAKKKKVPPICFLGCKGRKTGPPGILLCAQLSLVMLPTSTCGTHGLTWVPGGGLLGIFQRSQSKLPRLKEESGI